ncbi:hypothetical protein [Chryseobacterium ginsenosidimutans]|uniref:hypothetical protein n=1 Tax=Chryseobacterium ginsenosidimutans TaxID=687846 RepID=UPI0027B930C5|nr:hypothetical protein [Chryseobacterium ginsenosidimutans]
MLRYIFPKAKNVQGVPKQRKGAFHDTESIKYFETAGIALEVYDIIKDKFLRIHEWASYSEYTFADFKLFDCKGKQAFRNPEKGDFVRINIKGCPDLGTPYFWVTIQDLTVENSADTQNIFIVFKPSYKPDDKHKRIEHFYSKHSTSTFMISRHGRKITVAVYGRNETANLSTHFLNKIKNMFTALLAIAGLSKIQWKIFTDSLLDIAETKS